MKIKNIKALFMSSLFLSFAFISPVSAINNYGIVYEGGEPLGADNVQIEPEMIDGLTQLIGFKRGNSITFQGGWLEGYYMISGSCEPIHYIKVNKNTNQTDLSFAITNDAYSLDVHVSHVVLDGDLDSLSNEDYYGFFVRENQAIMTGGGSADNTYYIDPECQTRMEGIKGMGLRDGIHLYAEIKMKVFSLGTKALLKSDQLYFEITDIDGAQSFKILNFGNRLAKSNMYAKSAEELQPTNPDVTLRNMFVSSGNYIYSEYTTSSLDTPDNSNILVKLNDKTQEDGLDMVFGFATSATSGYKFFARQYLVTYISDKNGSVSGITTENIVSGNNPSGSTTKPKDGYGLKYWLANQDVTLANGTVIKAGQPITPAQLKQIVVGEDLTFTAIHEAEPEIKAPNTGATTKTTNATKIGAAFVALGAVLAVVSIFAVAIQKFYRVHRFKK